MIEKIVPQVHKIIGISIMSVIDTIKGVFVGNIRHLNFKAAKREAIRRCMQENRKIYVIQRDSWSWQIFSTAEVRDLKKRGILKKSLTFKEMSEKSAFTAYPKKV